MSREFPYIGIAVGLVSLAAAIGNLAMFYWLSGFVFLFLGPMAFCGALVAISHGPWRIPSIAGFLALCGIIVAAPLRRPLYSWQLVLLFGAVAAGFLLACLLWANYRKDRNLDRWPRLADWLARIQRRIGLLLGVSSLALGITVWLQFDLSSCSFLSGHLAERFSSTRYVFSFLAPTAFLLGISAVGCGYWRSGALATYVSLGVLVALTHAVGDPISRELVLLAAPVSLVFYPLTLPPLHPYYNPWFSAILAAILFATWYAGKSRTSN